MNKTKVRKNLIMSSKTLDTLKKRHFVPLKIVIIYILVSMLWVLLTDNFVTLISNNLFEVKQLQNLKGFMFIFISACLLYFLIDSNIKTILKLEDTLKQRDVQNRLIVDDITDGIWEWDVQTNETYYSTNWKKTFEYEEHEIENQLESWKKLIHPDDIERTICAHEDYLSKRIPTFKVEYRARAKNGEYKWILGRGKAIWNEYDEPVRMVGIHTDITESKLILDALKESEEKFRRLFHNANDSIFLINIKDNGMFGRLIEVNDVMCKELGYTREELLERSIFDLRPPSMHSKIDKYRQIVLEEGHLTFELEQLTKEGTIIPIEVSSHAFILNNKNVILSIVRNITERKKAEKELQKMLEENKILLDKAAESDKLKTEFFSNISHELKTPLNIIFSTIQLLELYKTKKSLTLDTEKLNKHIKVMKQNSYRLLRLLNNLIDVTRLDAGFLQVNLQNCNVVEVVEKISLSVVDYIRSKNIDFLFNTDIEEKIIACDPDKIERIMLNLLSNAIKFTNKGGKIEVNIYDKGRSIGISVKDTGIGIAEDKQKIIFERFRQADASLTRKYEGSGIGLSLIKSLIELHQGSISLKSEYGKGSEFIIELPVQTVVEQDYIQSSKKTISNNKTEIINVEFSDIYSL